MRTNRRLSHGILLLACAFASSPAAADDAAVGYVHVITDPRGGFVLVDGTVMGRTPLSPIRVAAGRHEVWVRSNAPDTFEPMPLALRRIVVSAGDTVVVAEDLGRLHRVTSLPDGALVMLGSAPVGKTPLEFRWHRGDPTTVTLTREGYRAQRLSIDAERDRDTHVILVTDGSRDTAPVVTRDDGISLNWTAMGFLTAGAASAGLALYMKDKADRAYDDYLDSAVPGTMQDRLDDANRYDRYSSVAWLAAEAGIAAGVWFLIKPLFGVDVAHTRTAGTSAGVHLAWDF